MPHIIPKVFFHDREGVFATLAVNKLASSNAKPAPKRSDRLKTDDMQNTGNYHQNFSQVEVEH